MEIAIIEIPQISLGEDDSPLQLAIYSQKIESLDLSVEKIQNLMQQSGKYRDIHTDIKAKTPQIRLRLNRALAAEYGFSAQEIAMALIVLLAVRKKSLIIVREAKNMILCCLAQTKIPLWI